MSFFPPSQDGAGVAPAGALASTSDFRDSRDGRDSRDSRSRDPRDSRESRDAPRSSRGGSRDRDSRSRSRDRDGNRCSSVGSGSSSSRYDRERYDRDRYDRGSTGRYDDRDRYVVPSSSDRYSSSSADRDRERDRDRDRSDRDRERERERERERDRGRGGRSDRDRDRDRSDRERGGGGGDRGRDSYRGDRDRDRASDRERGSDRERDRPAAFDSDAVARSLASGDSAPGSGSSAVAAVHPSRAGLVGSASAAPRFSHQTDSAAATGSTGPAVPNSGLNPILVAQTRLSRRIFIGNLPAHPALTDRIVQQFFELFMSQRGFTTPGPIINVALAAERTYCFAELRSVADAVALVLLLDGQEMGGRRLRVSRPRDFTPAPPALANFIVGLPPGSFLPPVSTPVEAALLNATVAAQLNSAAALAALPAPVQSALTAELGQMGLLTAVTAAAKIAPVPVPVDPATGRVTTGSVVVLSHLLAEHVTPTATTPTSTADAVETAASKGVLSPLSDSRAWLDLVDDIRSQLTTTVLTVTAAAGAPRTANSDRELQRPVLRVIVPRTAPFDPAVLSEEAGRGGGVASDGSEVDLAADCGPVNAAHAGSVWVLMSSEQGARAVVEAMHGRLYRRNKVVATFGTMEEFEKLLRNSV